MFSQVVFEPAESADLQIQRQTYIYYFVAGRLTQNQQDAIESQVGGSLKKCQENIQRLQGLIKGAGGTQSGVNTATIAHRQGVVRSSLCQCSHSIFTYPRIALTSSSSSTLVYKLLMLIPYPMQSIHSHLSAQMYTMPWYSSGYHSCEQVAHVIRHEVLVAQALILTETLQNANEVFNEAREQRHQQQLHQQQQQQRKKRRYTPSAQVDENPTTLCILQQDLFPSTAYCGLEGCAVCRL